MNISGVGFLGPLLSLGTIHQPKISSQSGAVSRNCSNKFLENSLILNDYASYIVPQRVDSSCYRLQEDAFKVKRTKKCASKCIWWVKYLREKNIFLDRVEGTRFSMKYPTTYEHIIQTK